MMRFFFKSSRITEKIYTHCYKKWYLELNQLSDTELLIRIDTLSDYESDRNFSHNLAALLSFFSTGLLTFCIGVITIFFSLMITNINIASDKLTNSELVLSKLTNLSEYILSKSWDTILFPVIILFVFFSCCGMFILGYFYYCGGNKRIKYHICKRILQQRQELNKHIFYKVHSELSNKKESLYANQKSQN